MTVRLLVSLAAEALPGLEAALPPGIRVRRHPLLEILPPPDPGAVARALAQPGWGAVAVTSPRGARALLAAWPARGAAAPPVWAVGGGTARALDTAPMHPHVADGGDARTSAAEALAAAMLGAGVTGPVLLVAGDPHRPELAARLADAGVAVEAVVAYRTAPVADVELTAALDRADLVLVGSPLLVRALAAQGEVAHRPGFVALGATTAEACRTAGLPLVAVADHPSPIGVADAVRRAAQLLSLDP